MSSTQSTKAKDLGCMNGWFKSDKRMAQVNKCYKNKHQIQIKNLGNCYNEYHCTQCNITWRIDSSG